VRENVLILFWGEEYTCLEKETHSESESYFIGNLENDGASPSTGVKIRAANLKMGRYHH
jgi:hypothetical protein